MPERVRELRDRIGPGLADAHHQGVIHRDLSPENIILPEESVAQAKIIDFGIAKLENASSGTIVGRDFAGRYAYASPEQFGMFDGKVDARSDIYSLGLVLAAAASGIPLDMGKTLMTVIRARETVPDLGFVPNELVEELTWMLQPNPADRPSSMEELLYGPEAVAAAMADGRGATAPPLRAGTVPPMTAPPIAPDAGARGPFSRPGTWAAILASVAIVAAGAWIVWPEDVDDTETEIAADGDGTGEHDVADAATGNASDIGDGTDVGDEVAVAGALDAAEDAPAPLLTDDAAPSGDEAAVTGDANGDSPPTVDVDADRDPATNQTAGTRQRKPPATSPRSTRSRKIRP